MLIGCKHKPSNKNEYVRDKNGLYYKLLAIGDGKQKPKNDAVIEIEAVMKTQTDSVFWDTYHDAKKGFYIFLDSGISDQSIHSYLLSLVEGDSVSFLEKPSLCFKDYFKSKVPYFCSNDSIVKIDIKLKRILTRKQYLTITHDTDDMFKLKEQEIQIINRYLAKHYPEAKMTTDNIYILEKLTTQQENVMAGKHIKIQYQGFLLDGKPVDITSQQLEFIYGTPDQIIKGLNIVIGTLKKGEFTKIIIPSSLAFGMEGNSNGSIPPFTPLVYNIKLIDIK